MQYFIPMSKQPKLIKKIQSIRNKGGDITFNCIEQVAFQEDEHIKGLMHKGSIFEVEGKYVINGWEFVGTIEHGNGRNIIRKVSDDFKVPERYYTAPVECEHCHKKINRKDTYLVFDTDTYEYKQVGKTCLMQYTGGLDAEVCAQMASVIDDCVYANEYGEEDFMIDFIRIGSGDNYVSTKSVLPVIYNYVKKHGYVSGVTNKEIAEIIFSNKENEGRASEKEIAEMSKWVEEKSNTRNDYFWNATTAYMKDYLEYRDVALIGSLCNTYFKEINKIAQNKKSSESEYVGNVGDKITIKIASYRVLFENHYEVAWHTYANSFTYEIVGTDGNVYILKISKELDKVQGEGDDSYHLYDVKPLELTAKVKDHKEYKGIKQTVLERGKVTKYEKITNESSSNDVWKALDLLLDD